MIIYWKAIDADTMSGENSFMQEFRTSEDYDYNDIKDSSLIMNFKIYAIEKSNLNETDAWSILKEKYNELDLY